MFASAGFKSLAAFQAAVPAEQFQEYVREHCLKKGCCLPPAPLENWLQARRVQMPVLQVWVLAKTTQRSGGVKQ
jgi:hypothetical protein